MFKETLNNIVRHSECRRVEIDLNIERSTLVLEVSDDGKGFDPGNSEGNGLVSLRRRSSASGGETVISSQVAGGTKVSIRIPRSRRSSISLETH
jgi:signal transduction histidine kinase